MTPPSIQIDLSKEMGLEKTLSALSLICHSLDQWEKDPSLTQGMPKTTLIITPKSSTTPMINKIQLGGPHIEHADHWQLSTGGRSKSRRM